MPQILVTEIDDRSLTPYRSLKFTSQMRRARLFIAEGDTLVKRLLGSGIRMHSVLISDHFLASRSIEIPPDVTTFVVPDAMIPDIVGFKFHRGVLACGFRAADQSLAQALERFSVRDEAQADPGVTSRIAVVVCVDIHDPTNLGTILRTAQSFGVAAVVLGGHCADPYSRRVLRVSMGAPFQVPVIPSMDLAADLSTLRQDWKLALIAAVANAAGEPLDQVDRPERLAILLGNERHGLSPQWTALCDRCVTIPMHPGSDSLNVAVASGIFLYHFCGPSNPNRCTNN